MTFEEWWDIHYGDYFYSRVKWAMERAWHDAQEQLLKEMYPLREFNDAKISNG